MKDRQSLQCHLFVKPMFPFQISLHHVVIASMMLSQSHLQLDLSGKIFALAIYGDVPDLCLMAFAKTSHPDQLTFFVLGGCLAMLPKPSIIMSVNRSSFCTVATMLPRESTADSKIFTFGSSSRNHATRIASSGGKCPSPLLHILVVCQH